MRAWLITDYPTLSAGAARLALGPMRSKGCRAPTAWAEAVADPGSAAAGGAGTGCDKVKVELPGETGAQSLKSHSEVRAVWRYVAATPQRHRHRPHE